MKGNIIMKTRAFSPFSILSFAIILAILTIPVFAGMADELKWVDSVPGLGLIKNKQTSYKVEKEYSMTEPAKSYNQVVKGFQNRGWQTMQGEPSDIPGLYKYHISKDGYFGKIDADFDDGLYVLEIEIKTAVR